MTTMTVSEMLVDLHKRVSKIEIALSGNTNALTDYARGKRDGTTEKLVLSKMQTMCEQSLDPETFEKWNDVRHVLESVRSDLK